MTITGYDDAAFKNGITRQEIDYVIAEYPNGSTRLVEESESKNGNSVDTFVGATAAGKFIEVMVEYLDGQDWYFHADMVSPTNEDKYNKVR